MVKADQAHYLTPNKDRGKPETLLFFDVETEAVPLSPKITQHKIRLGWALFWRRRPERDKDTLLWQYFETTEGFWDFVLKHTSEKNTLYLIAHNVSFDFGVLDGFRQLEQAGYRLQSVYTKGMTTILRFAKGRRKIIVLDNGNIFKTSLGELGEALGLPKGKVDFNTCTHEELSAYCKRDVEILLLAWQTWFRFLEVHDLGKFGFTLPSQAMNAFRHRFMKHLLLVHKDPETLELERRAYRGGRTSIFYVGKIEGKPVYKLDVNSAYPWAMKGHRMPIQHLFTTDRASIEEIKEWLKTACVVADVDVEVTENPFPVHYRGHNIYPVGRFTTTLTTPDLEYALQRGWVKAVHKAAIYRSGCCFDDYVDYFYTLKQQYAKENNKPFYYITKLFLNSLYGKFGQKASRFVQFGKADDVVDEDTEILDNETGEHIVLYRFGDTLWREIDEGESYNSMPAISAHITAYVRMRLYELRKIAGEDHVYYMDTDSLFVDEIGYERLKPYIDPLELGKLKVEGIEHHVVFNAPKNYCFGTKWTRKGIPANAVQVAPNAWEFEKFHSLRTLGQIPPDWGYVTEKSKRELKYVLYDGIRGADGWVKPFRAEELNPNTSLSPEVAERAWELEMQRAALKESKRLPQSVIFALWDYRKGCFKRARDSRGNLVPLEYSNWDSRATELGFDCLDDLLKAVEIQIKMDEDIRTINHELSILYALSRSPETRPL